MIKSIFNIFVYKHQKSSMKTLIKILTQLIDWDISKINAIFSKNFFVLMNYVKKGKDIDKVFFSFSKLFLRSWTILHENFDELIGLLTTSKNRFFLENCLKLISKITKKTYLNKFIENSKSRNLQFINASLINHLKKTLQNFSRLGLLGKEN